MNGYEIAGKCLVAAIGIAGFFTLLVVGALLLFLFWPRKHNDE